MQAIVMDKLEAKTIERFKPNAALTDGEPFIVKQDGWSALFAFISYRL